MNYLIIITIIYLDICGIIQTTKLNNPKTKSSDINDNTKSNLNHLGNRIYGFPSEESGKKLAEWSQKKNRQGNPEELGEYAEGDILFSTASGKNGLIDKRRHWPGGQIPYYIEGHFTPNERNMIYLAMEEFHIHSCIRFVPWNGHRDYIRITSDWTGCHSSVGYSQDIYAVNLQRPGCVSEIGTIIHELMHAIGFVHEQSRYDRDQYIYIDFANIAPGYVDNFQKFSSDDVDNFGVAYDYESIMHYSSEAFSRDGRDVIFPRYQINYRLGQRRGLSTNDVIKINKMYKCDNKGRQTMPNNYINNQGYYYWDNSIGYKK